MSLGKAVKCDFTLYQPEVSQGKAMFSLFTCQKA